jgi:hypothetical protein
MYTGCTITLCSDFLRPPCGDDDERGMGLPPEKVGVPVGVTICGKSCRSSSDNGNGQMLRDGTALQRRFSRRQICMTVRVSWRSLFSK